MQRPLGAGGVALGFLVESGPVVLPPHGIVVVIVKHVTIEEGGHGSLCNRRNFNRLLLRIAWFLKKYEDLITSLGFAF